MTTSDRIIDRSQTIEIRHMGTVSYLEALSLQREIRDALISGAGHEVMLVLEHPPVVTYGKRTPPADLAAGDGASTSGSAAPGSQEEFFRARGIELVQVERGGLATYHAPGQIVVYPILDLRRRGWSVRRYLDLLQASVIQLLDKIGLKSHCGEREAGIWVGSRKISSFGIHIRRGVSIHGVSLNADIDLDGFRCIRPCGESPDVMTSIERELQHPIDRAEIERRFVETLRQSFITQQMRGACIR